MQNRPMNRFDPLKAELAAAAARRVVEEGMEYGPAKRAAAADLGCDARTGLPSNDEVEQAVREHIALFCADTQAQELVVLRRMAMGWMQRMAAFRPHLGGAVWYGTATRWSDIYIQLFCDDSKSAEIALIDMRLDYQVGAVTGFRGEVVDALTVFERQPAWPRPVAVHLLVYDHADLRGALKPDAQGRLPRASLAVLRERWNGLETR